MEHGITSDEAFHLPALPRRVLMVGGGYIAMEFAGIFAGLGAEVHVVFRQHLPLRGFDHGPAGGAGRGDGGSTASSCIRARPCTRSSATATCAGSR